MKPWMGWTLLALFLAALLVVQFIPGHDGENPPAAAPQGDPPA
jgi:hypothetical protein